MGHSLEITHIEDEISFMNPINSFTHYGFLNNDSARVAALFEFREFAKGIVDKSSEIKNISPEYVSDLVEEFFF